MESHHALLRHVACVGVLALFMGVCVSAPNAAAQAPTVPVGVYSMKNRLNPNQVRRNAPADCRAQGRKPKCWQEVPMDFALPRQLFLTTNTVKRSLTSTVCDEGMEPGPDPKTCVYSGPVYVYGNRWGAYHTGYAPMPDGTMAPSFELCGFWTGYVAVPSVYLIALATSGEEQWYYAERGSERPPAFPEPELFKACSKTSPKVGFVLAAGQQTWPQWLALQQPPSPRRAIDGELLLALKQEVLKNPSSAPDDTEKWACAVSNGYPGLELIEQPDGPARDVYVWPDGTFQALVRRGATYEWRLRDRKCRMPEMQASTENRFQVPTAAVQEKEKLLLACYITGQRFSDCYQWWLTRP